MKKKLLLIGVIFVLFISGCSSNKEEHKMIILCNKVNTIVDDYNNNNIDTDKFISEIKSLVNDCNTDDYLCGEMKTFTYLENNLKSEIYEEHANQLKTYCQMVKDKYSK